MRPKKIYVSDTFIKGIAERPGGAWSIVYPENPTISANEYTDLSQVWHDAEEHPESDNDILIEHRDGYTVGWYGNTYHNEEGFPLGNVNRWAYIEDLIPAI